MGNSRIRPIKRTWKNYGGESCSLCKGPNDPYTIKNKLWKSVIGKDGNARYAYATNIKTRKLEAIKVSGEHVYVCLECFEKELGRELVYEDFKKFNALGMLLPINHGDFGFDARKISEIRKNENE